MTIYCIFIHISLHAEIMMLNFSLCIPTARITGTSLGSARSGDAARYLAMFSSGKGCVMGRSGVGRHRRALGVSENGNAANEVCADGIGTHSVMLCRCES